MASVKDLEKRLARKAWHMHWILFSAISFCASQSLSLDQLSGNMMPVRRGTRHSNDFKFPDGCYFTAFDNKWNNMISGEQRPEMLKIKVMLRHFAYTYISHTWMPNKVQKVLIPNWKISRIIIRESCDTHNKQYLLSICWDLIDC